MERALHIYNQTSYFIMSIENVSLTPWAMATEHSIQWPCVYAQSTDL